MLQVLCLFPLANAISWEQSEERVTHRGSAILRQIQAELDQSLFLSTFCPAIDEKPRQGGRLSVRGPDLICACVQVALRDDEAGVSGDLLGREDVGPRDLGEGIVA